MSNFDNFLAVFAQSGNRYNAALRLVMSGKASGMSAEDIIDRAHGVGVTDRDADLRRIWNQSKVDPNRRSSSWRPSRPSAPRLSPEEQAEERRKKLDPRLRQFVPVTLRNYAKTAFTGHMTADAFAETIRMSEDAFLDAAGADIYPKQAALQLRALFRPGEKVWAGWIIKDEAVRARLGFRHTKTPLKPPAALFTDRNAFALALHGIYNAHTLADIIETGVVAKIPPHISLNPVTGKPDENGSFDSSQTIAAYRHLLLEWDNLFDLGADGMKTPSQAHIETVAGLLDCAFDTDIIRPLVAVYTGGKSIHVALRVKADGLNAYKRQTAHLADLFQSADDETFRADDKTGWDNGYTHLRLAGAIRPETGRRARLLWANTASFDRRANSKGGE